MSISEVATAVKVRHCRNCGQRLDAAIPASMWVCRNERVCNARAERLKATGSAHQPITYDFVEGSVAWHITRAIAKHYKKQPGDLRKLNATAEEARIKNLLCYMLRQDAKVSFIDIALHMGFTAPTKAQTAHHMVAMNMQSYRINLGHVRDSYQMEMLANPVETPPSLLRAVE